MRTKIFKSLFTNDFHFIKRIVSVKSIIYKKCSYHFGFINNLHKNQYEYTIYFILIYYCQVFHWNFLCPKKRFNLVKRSECLSTRNPILPSLERFHRLIQKSLMHVIFCYGPIWLVGTSSPNWDFILSWFPLRLLKPLLLFSSSSIQMISLAEEALPL